MANVSLLNLPVELLHRIFDHLDVQTIFRSVRRVCKQLVVVINTYGRLELNFTSISLLDLRLISRFMQPENVISLSTSDGGKKLSRKIHVFFSLFDLGRFTQLRSLSLGKINNANLEKFLQHIATTSLVSLSIDVFENETENSQITGLLSSAIARSHLRKLQLKNFDYKIDHMSLPIQSALYHLTIGTCTFSQYNAILDRCPHLRIFVMKSCTMNNNDTTFSSSSACECYAQLTSLAISDCRLSIEDLEPFLSLTPSLVHLKLVSFRLLFDSVFLGSFWRLFIRTKLPLLDKFDFFFTCSFRENANTPSLESIITPFRAPFWLDDKHWFATCDYIIDLAQITLYTKPVRMNNAQYFIRHEASSLNGLRLLTECWTNDTVDVPTEKPLITLQINQIPIGDQAVQYFADALKNNTTMTTIGLRENAIGVLQLQYLANTLQNHMTVTTLEIEANQIGDQEVHYFADILRHNATLTALSLSENQIGDQGVQLLAEALRENTTLTLLNLRFNQIGEQGAQYLDDALQNNVTLTTLYLGSNQIGHRGAQHFADMLRKNTSLISLELDQNQIGHQGAQHLAAALRNNTTLTDLSLRDNQIGDEGAQHLAEALRDNKTLTKFYLEGNQIGASGAQHLASALRNNTTLTDLFLGGNQIGDRGVQYLADGLRDNQVLIFLHLYGNQIGDKGAQYLADALSENMTLTQINIESNQIGDEGAQHFANALRYNSTLTYLVLYDNQIGDKGAEYLADALLNNTTMTGLHLDDERVGDDAIRRIKQLIQRNLKLSSVLSKSNEDN